MAVRVIDGEAIAAQLSQCVAEGIRRIAQEHGIEPGLAVITVGESPASGIHARSRAAKTAAICMRSSFHKLPSTVSQTNIVVGRLNQDATVHGILVQFPLPPQVDHAGLVSSEKYFDASPEQAPRKRP